MRFKLGEHNITVIFRRIVYNNNLEIVMLLLQHGRQVPSQVGGFVACADNNRYRHFVASGSIVTTCSPRSEVISQIVEHLHQKRQQKKTKKRIFKR